MDMKVTVAIIALSISLIGITITGGISYGQLSERVDNLKEEMEVVEEIGNQVNNIDREQGITQSQIQTMKEHQEEFRSETKEALKEILEKLNER